jgi:nucleoside-diphosphate-sugar epimerase
MSVLIIGGYGFVGSSVLSLLEKDDSIKYVIIVDNNTAARAAVRSKKIRCYNIGINQTSYLHDIIKNYNITHILNLSASHKLNNINYLVDLKNLLDACIECNVQHFHHTYCDATVAYADELLITENTQLTKNNTHSFLHSSILELVLAYYNHGINTTGSIACNLYGQNQSLTQFISKSISNIKNNNKITIYGDGSHLRNWLHVDDYSRALISILNSNEIKGETIVISSNHDISNIEIADMICKNLKVPLLTHTRHIEGGIQVDPYKKLYRSYKKSSLINWTQNIDIDSGIKSLC